MRRRQDINKQFILLNRAAIASHKKSLGVRFRAFNPFFSPVWFSFRPTNLRSAQVTSSPPSLRFTPWPGGAGLPRAQLRGPHAASPHPGHGGGERSRARRGARGMCLSFGVLSWCPKRSATWVWVKMKPGIGPQVLKSIPCTRIPCWVHVFDPPCGLCED